MPATPSTSAAVPAEEKKLTFFERYLSAWVALCMVAGIGLGKALPSVTQSLRGLEFGAGSQINIPLPC